MDEHMYLVRDLIVGHDLSIYCRFVLSQVGRITVQVTEYRLARQKAANESSPDPLPCERVYEPGCVTNKRCTSLNDGRAGSSHWQIVAAKVAQLRLVQA